MTKETKVNALQTPFSFIGYINSKIILNKTKKSSLMKVEIVCFDVVFDEFINVCTVGIRVNLTYDDSSGNTFEYLSDFIISDSELINVLKSADFTKKDASTTNIDQVISMMLSSVFPYIRQHISAVTSDSTRHVTLPTIDVRSISLRKGLELTTKKSVRKNK